MELSGGRNKQGGGGWSWMDVGARLVTPNSFLGPNSPGMRGLILVLMLNVCYLAVILIFLVVTWWLLLVT